MVRIYTIVTSYKAEKKPKQKYLGRIDTEKPVILRTYTEKEVAEVIMKIGESLIERKHLEKWIRRLKMKENMDMLKILFVEQ